MSFFDLFKTRKTTTPDEAPAEVPTNTDAGPAPEEAIDAGATPATVGPLAIHAKDLWQAFHDNQIAAELAYLDRPLLVSGEVDHVDRDHKDRIRVHLKVSDYYSLQAYFPEEARDLIAGLRPSQAVRLLARIRSADSGTATLEAEASSM